MNVRQWISVNVATLAVLGTVLFGMGKQSVALPIAALLAAAVSVWLTDVTGRFRLCGKAVNVALVAAAAVSIAKTVRASSVDVLAVADVLVYVQIILLFEEKTLRTWWDLIMLSLLEVLVAAQMNQGPLFGVILVAYLFFGLSTLALLLLYREQTVSDEPGSTAEASGSLLGSGREDHVDWRRLAKIAGATVVVGPLSLFLRYRATAAGGTGVSPVLPKHTGKMPVPPGRWPHPGRPPVLAGSPDAASNSPQVGRPFWAKVTGMAFISLLVSVVVFCAVPRFGRFELMFPRFGRFTWRDRDTSTRRAVGFSDRVVLGELGTIIDNPEEVLEVRFLDHQTGQRYPIQGDVYLRGAVLTRYEAGEWECRGLGIGPRFRVLRPDDLPPDVQLVRQEITIQPMDRQELFCVWPFVVVEQDDRLRFNPQNERLRRPRDSQKREFSFALGTTAFADQTQAELVPCQRAVDTQALLQRAEDSLPGLAALAAEWIEASAIPGHDLLARARYLETQFRESRRFEYTLEAPVRDSTLDPIEDFIVNHPQGHCEYFATALTLMLRSQGIPARLVVGYKCDEYSFLSQAYRVRQSHAHTWVEAYLPPSVVLPELPEGTRLSDWSNGAWLRLDPTPTGSGPVAVVGIVVKEVENWFQWLRSVWKEDVLGMDRSRQHDLIYRPLYTGIKETVRTLLDPGWWRAVLRSVERGLAAPAGIRPTGRLLGWRLGLLAAIAVFGLVLAVFGSRLFRRRLAWLLPGLRSAKARNLGAKIAFYRRLEAVLARYGLTRSASQTQREFAQEAGARIGESTGQSRLVNLPVEVAEAFYQVRFGGLALDRNQAAAVDQALSRLERASNGSYGGIVPRRRTPRSP